MPRGIADERDSADRTVTPTGNKTKMNGFVEISTLLIHSAPKQKCNEWMHLSPFYTRMHGEWLRYAKSTSQFNCRFLLGLRHLDSHRETTTGTSGALTIWLCCVWNKLLVRLAGGELAPRLSLVSPKVFFSVLFLMEFWFLAVVASGLLSWEHFISSDITDLIAQILFKLNWAGKWHHWIQ